MKKILNLLFLLVPCIVNGQSNFIGAHITYGIATFRNKEDASAGDMLVKKNRPTLGYGLNFGRQFNKHFSVELTPNYINYKIDYTGVSDSDQYRKIRVYTNYEFLNLPLVVNYHFFAPRRFQMSIGLGFNFGYLLDYKEELYAVPSYAPSREDIYGCLSGRKSTTIYNKQTDTTTGYYDAFYYKRFNYALQSKVGFSYALSDYFSLQLYVNTLYGLNDFENKKKAVTGYYTDSDHPDMKIPINYIPYKESEYYKYYKRPVHKYNTRPATHAFTLGGGISIRYYLKGDLLPSIHKN